MTRKPDPAGFSVIDAVSAPVDEMKAADIAILRPLGRKYRSGRATPEEAAAFEAANDRQMARQRAASNQVKSWWDLPVARACWEDDAREQGGAA